MGFAPPALPPQPNRDLVAMSLSELDAELEVALQRAVAIFEATNAPGTPRRPDSVVLAQVVERTCEILRANGSS